jgi:hypothetical protein
MAQVAISSSIPGNFFCRRGLFTALLKRDIFIFRTIRELASNACLALLNHLETMTNKIIDALASTTRI